MKLALDGDSQRTISKMSYWAARGLAEFHGQLKKKLEEIEAMIAALLGELEDSPGSAYYGHISDGLWEEMDIDEILRRMSITLEDEVENEPT